MHDCINLKVIVFLFDPNVGGPTIRSRTISEKLRNENVDIVFALPHTDGSAKVYLESLNFTVIDLEIIKPVMPKKLWAFFKFVLSAPYSIIKIFFMLKKEKPDLVHINGAFDILPAVSAKIAGVAVLWHLNDMVFGKRLSLTLGKFVAVISTSIAVSTERVANHYGISKGSFKVLRVPVDTDNFLFSSKEKIEPYKIGFIGNWNPLKGQEDFISIIKRLNEEYGDVEARMMGKLLNSQESYWRPILETLKDSGLDHKVSVLNFVENIPEALRDIDLLLITSVSEAGPMSCVEAMAAGIPVISYDVGDVNNMLLPGERGQCGFVVPNGDLNAMFDGCLKLISDSELYEQFSKAARERAVRAYSVAKSVRRTHEVYSSAAGKCDD